MTAMTTLKQESFWDILGVIAKKRVIIVDKVL